VSEILPQACIAGWKRYLQRVAEEREQVAARKYVEPYTSAVIYAFLGETEQALQELEKAYTDRSVFDDAAASRSRFRCSPIRASFSRLAPAFCTDGSTVSFTRRIVESGKVELVTFEPTRTPRGVRKFQPRARPQDRRGADWLMNSESSIVTRTPCNALKPKS
jgi:hypothetical protein